MRYVVTYTEDTTVSSNLPPQAIWETVAATHQYCEDLKKQNKITEYGFHAAGHGGTVIYSCNTGAELQILSECLPARFFCQVTCTPLIDNDEFPATFNKVRSTVQPQLEKLQAAIAQQNANTNPNNNRK